MKGPVPMKVSGLVAQAPSASTTSVFTGQKVVKPHSSRKYAHGAFRVTVTVRAASSATTFRLSVP